METSRETSVWMTSQLIEILFVSRNGNELVMVLESPIYHVQNVNDPGQAMETLRNGQVDVILLEDELFSKDINRMIKEKKIAGAVLKNSNGQALAASLDQIAGITYLREGALQKMPRVRIPKKENRSTRLTGREMEVLRLIEQEYSNKQIAQTLLISERTVETHRKNIFRKTKTNNVIGLIKYAYEHKLV